MPGPPMKLKLHEGRNHICLFHHSISCKEELRKYLLKGRKNCFIFVIL